jgi:hypothetical protein
VSAPTSKELIDPAPVAAMVTVPEPLLVVVIPVPAAKVIVPEFDIVELEPVDDASVKLSKGLLLVIVTVPVGLGELDEVLIPVPPVKSTVTPLDTL